MPQELKNTEKTKFEIPQVKSELNTENLDVSKVVESSAETLKDKEQESVQISPVSQKIQASDNQPSNDDILKKQIEDVLEANLRDLYINMPKNKQEEFKKRGEQIIVQINLLLKDVKVHVKKIFHLIFNWLSIIPGVNKVFLKQEAKIKTDQILSLKNKQK